METCRGICWGSAGTYLMPEMSIHCYQKSNLRLEAISHPYEALTVLKLWRIDFPHDLIEQVKQLFTWVDLEGRVKCTGDLLIELSVVNEFIMCEPYLIWQE